MLLCSCVLAAEFKDEDIEGRPTRDKIRILHTMGYEFNSDKLNQIKQAYTQRHFTRLCGVQRTTM